MLPAELVALILVYLPLESLSRGTLQVNRVFYYTTREHIKTVVCPLRKEPFNIQLTNVMWISRLDLHCRNIGDADLINFAGAIARGHWRI